MATESELNITQEALDICLMALDAIGEIMGTKFDAHDCDLEDDDCHACHIASLLEAVNHVVRSEAGVERMQEVVKWSKQTFKEWREQEYKYEK